MAHIFSESYQACQRRDKCSGAADIYTDKKIGIIFSELRKKNRWRNITDNLTWKNTEKKRIFRKQEREKSVNFGDTRHISCKNKEEYKR